MSLGRELNDFAATFGMVDSALARGDAARERRARRKAIDAKDPMKSPEMKGAMAAYQKDYGVAPPEDTGGWGGGATIMDNWGTGEGAYYEKGGYVDEDPQYYHSEYADGGYVEPSRAQREAMLAGVTGPGVPSGIPVQGVPSETLEEDNWRNAGNDDSSVYEPEPARGDPVMTAPMSRPGERAPSDYRNSPPPAQPASTPARASAIPVPTSGGYSTPGNAPARKALNDQTRTEAYDPEQDGPGVSPAPAPAGATAQPAAALPAGAVGAVRGEPYNPSAKGEGSSPSAADDLQAAIKGGLEFAQQTFHLKGTSALPGTDPHQQRGGEALMKGVGAAPPEAVAKLNRAVNAGVPRDEAIWGIRRLEAVYRFYSTRGETEKANKAAFELLQYSAGMAAKYGTQAVQAIKQGDEKGAMDNILNAHRFVPDGRKLVPVEGGKAVDVVDLKTGDVLEQLPVTPQAMFQLAMGLSNRSAYWDVIMHRAAGTGGNRDRQTPEQKAQTIARTKLIEARTAKLQGGGTGRAAPSSGASTGLLDKIREMDAKTGVGGGGAPRAPAPAPVAQGSTDDTSDEEDEPRGVRPPNADGEGGGETASSPAPAAARAAPDSVLRVKPPRADQATNVSPSALVGGAGPGGDRAASTAPTAGPAAVPPKGSRPTPTAKTWDGYPARQNDDGSQSTEYSITVTDPRLNNGRPTNIPSMWRGVELDEENAIKNAVSHGAVWPSFKTTEEAVKAAAARSEAKGRGENVGDPFKPDPDAVPDQEIWINGQGGYQRPPAAPEPVPFDEEKPGPNPYKALQVEAAKIPGREGVAARQLLAKRVADYDKQASGWEKRKKEHDKAEKLRVTSEGKAIKEAQKKLASENGYNLKTDRAQDGITLGKELDESYSAVEERFKQPGADGKPPDIKATVFGDGSATKEQLKDLALDIRTTNPRTNAEKAFRLIEQLVRIDPDDRSARGYKVVGRDAIGNVVLSIADKNGEPTRNVVHIRPPAFDALKGIVKQRYELRAKAAEKPPEGGFWKDVDAASKATSKGVTSAGKYALGVRGPSSMAGDLLRAGKKIGQAVVNPAPLIAGAVESAVRKGAKSYDPDEPSSKVYQGIPTP